YSKFACHELNFFLSKKDPAFFAEVVKAYLANKKDKTYLDHWLLGVDLGGYLDPWKFGQLNAVERVLMAKRIAAEIAPTTRHLDDLLRLQPPTPDRTLVLFDTAILGRSLAAGESLDELGVTFLRARTEAEAKKDLAQLQLRLKDGTVPNLAT